MAFVKYSLLRIALFVPLFALLVVLQLGWLLAVLFAALISFTISYLFFREQRDAALAGLHARFSHRARSSRSVKVSRDDEMEDRRVSSSPDITADNFIRNKGSESSPGMRS